MAQWRNAMWLYPWDAADEGVSQVVTAIHSRAGINGINIALSYHSGMFLLPHNPRKKLFFPTPGLYFQPDTARYASLRIQPRIDDLAATGVVEALRAETARRGMELTAWTVCLHNTGIGTAYPEMTIVNAFGDRHFAQLCPANPDVRAYIRTVVEDLAARDFDAILVESLEYMLAQHGYHHEVIGLPLTSFTKYLLGLCFCTHCLAAAQAKGVDGRGVQRFVQRELQAFFDGNLDTGREDITWAEVQQLAGGELGGYHQMRVDVVTSLYAELRSNWPQQQTRLEVCDFGPLYPFFDGNMGHPSGLHIGQVRPFIDALHPTPYHLSPEANMQAMQVYRATVPAGVPIIPAIRAIPPQVLNESGLRAMMQACNPAKSAGFTFYNYGFMRMTTLDWIQRSLATLATEVPA